MLIKYYRPLWNDTSVKFSFGNSGHENNNCYKYHIDEDEHTIETMIERVQNIKGVKGVERVKATRLHFLKEASRKVTGSPNQKKSGRTFKSGTCRACKSRRCTQSKTCRTCKTCRTWRMWWGVWISTADPVPQSDHNTLICKSVLIGLKVFNLSCM